MRVVPLLLLLTPAASLAEAQVTRDSVLWADSTPTRITIWAPAGASARLPTLIFSPGFGQVPGAYATLLEQWAKHGYLVIGVAHPPFKDPDNMEVGEASPVIARQLVRAFGYITRTRNDPGSPFVRMDLARIGAVGHSVGGSAAAQACAWEPRLKAGMNLDGTIFGEVVHTGMRQPFFLVRQKIYPSPGDRPRFLELHDQASLHEDSVWAHTATMYWLTVDHLEHMAFTDAALAPTPGQRVKTATGLGISAQQVQEITTRYVVDFFGHYLSGAVRAGSLDRSPFDGTTLKAKR